ncbi:DUF116 domain-containing protein [Marinisporobacter balticus]|uniref:DUF116 domain-containing protein n=1 Tax=Marinisporobacter balticus TaxID=2018667 RepID=A0A4V2SCD6_9FIRM|nr:DUF116 domain-containing protein [Marinisporobacter balticus]TCO78980.1 hypothetical protein EV214_10330 [Marinisporobacter balticus]
MIKNSIKKNDVFFITILFLLIIVSSIVAVLSFYLVHSSNMVLYKIFLNILVIVTTFISLLLFMNGIIIIKLLKGKSISCISRKIVQISLSFIYTNTVNLSRLLGLDKNKIRSVFSELNNRLILLSNTHVVAEEILVLLPHCLQKSSCPHKITNHIDNCKRCGLCDIDKLIELKEKYNIKLFVATGGTLARKIIKETKPKAIIAVACERDLSSGILDVKNIPVIGILNERPEGPCVNTRVNLKKVEETIQYFITEVNFTKK